MSPSSEQRVAKIVSVDPVGLQSLLVEFRPFHLLGYTVKNLLSPSPLGKEPSDQYPISDPHSNFFGQLSRIRAPAAPDIRKYWKTGSRF